MTVLTIAVTVAAIAAFAGVAAGDFAKAPAIVDNAVRVGVPLSWMVPLGLLKVAGAAGLALGLAGVTPVGVAAAIGLAAYFVGAVITHLRAGNHDLAYPLGFLGLAVAALAAQLAR
jgi:hypothetical protein